MVYCPVCGSENPEDAKECGKCGQNLEHVLHEIEHEEKEFSLLTIAGYVFVILGLFSLGLLSIVGIILGYKTSQQKHPRAQTHGFIIIVLNLVVIIFWAWIIFLIPHWWQSTPVNVTLPRF